MKTRAKQIWEAMTAKQQDKALVYYCNLVHQVHHNCEHGHRDFAILQDKGLLALKAPHVGRTEKEYDESERRLKNLIEKRYHFVEYER